MSGGYGFFNPGLMFGTLVFAILGIVASCVASGMAAQTKNISKRDSRTLGLIVVWTATVCMWLFWACVYMHQMVPLIKPIHTKPMGA